MTFDEIRGNDSVKAALKGMVDSGRVPHAILFHENDGGGAFPVAQAFLQYLYYGEEGNPKIDKLMHPDIHYVFPTVASAVSETYIEKFRDLVSANPFFTESQLDDCLGFQGKSTMIAVAQSKAILDKLAFNSLEGGYRTIVVYLPEKMNTESANRLLKSIEEPSAKTQFILISHSPEKVLPTITSRCQSIRIRPVDHNAVTDEEEFSQFRDLFISLMDSLLSRDLLSSQEVGEQLAALPSREKMKAFCRYASGKLRSVFMLQQGMGTLAADNDEYVGKLSSHCKKTFPRAAEAVLDRTVMLIERNVNQKILFCDMVDRLFLTV